MRKFAAKTGLVMGFAGWVGLGMATVAVLGLGVAGFLGVAAASAAVANLYIIPALECE